VGGRLTHKRFYRGQGLVEDQLLIGPLNLRQLLAGRLQCPQKVGHLLEGHFEDLQGTQVFGGFLYL
jgi:hypothetical protein